MLWALLKFITLHWVCDPLAFIQLFDTWVELLRHQFRGTFLFLFFPFSESYQDSYSLNACQCLLAFLFQTRNKEVEIFSVLFGNPSLRRILQQPKSFAILNMLPYATSNTVSSLKAGWQCRLDSVSTSPLGLPASTAIVIITSCFVTE